LTCVQGSGFHAQSELLINVANDVRQCAACPGTWIEAKARRGTLDCVINTNWLGEEARDGEQLPAPHLHFHTLYFFQESVVFLNNGALKSTLAPAQRITGIISYWGMEMFILARLDEFNHLIDGHSNLLLTLMLLPGLNLRLLYRS